MTDKIEQNTWLGASQFFMNVVKNFFHAICIKRIANLQADTSDDFLFWRMTEERKEVLRHE